MVERGVYRFAADTDAPRVLDGGANLGLATLATKSDWPASRITAFEPDSAIFGMLERNLARWGWTDVACVRAALWRSAGTLPFRGNGADGGRLVAEGDEPTERVAAVRLRELLTEPVDLLKLDVEGAEVELLRDCAESLGTVRHLAVEFHSFLGRPQELHVVLEILAHAGFRVTVEAAQRDRHPLLGARVSNEKDGYVEIFARRVPK